MFYRGLFKENNQEAVVWISKLFHKKRTIAMNAQLLDLCIPSMGGEGILSKPSPPDLTRLIELTQSRPTERYPGLRLFRALKGTAKNFELHLNASGDPTFT